jgi:hypothetical protein
MAVINPESKITFEEVPITISNTVDLTENELTLSLDSKPTTDVVLEGKILELRKLTKENIRVTMEIQNPSEGKNEGNLSVSVPNNIKYSLKDSTAIVQLEKDITQSFDISVELPESINKANYDIDKSFDSVDISGHRSLIKRIDKIVAVIKEENFETNKKIGVQLKAVDSKGSEIENIRFSSTIVQIKLTEMLEKEVLVNTVFDDEDEQIKDTINIFPLKVTIRGNVDLVKNIESVSTKLIDIKSLEKEKELMVELEPIDGIEFVTDNEVKISFKVDTID